jgi:type IV fimbrial biogenesis protein FimT
MLVSCRHESNGHMPKLGRIRGVTLIELMVTLSVVVILATLAAPSFTRLVANERMSTQTNEFIAGLNLAKSEALRRGVPVTLRAAVDASPNDFHRGWATFPDADQDGEANDPNSETDGKVLRASEAIAGATTIIRVTRSGAPGAFTYAVATSSLSSRQYVTFDPRGATNAGGASFFRICDLANSTMTGRIIQVSNVGRVSLDTTTTPCN